MPLEGQPTGRITAKPNPLFRVCPQSHANAGILTASHLSVAFEIMHSTRKPPFCPPPLPGEEDAPGMTNIVRLRQGRRDAEAGPVPEGDEPPWRQAFVLAEGVKATRTPDKVIRARNGHAEPPSTEPGPSAPAVTATGEHVRSVIGQETIGAPEPAIRSQIAELGSALASKDPVS